MSLKVDVLVIGAGAAGCAAAAEAARAGARTLVLYAAPGATALSSGSLDVASLPEETLDPLATGRSYAQDVERIVVQAPAHPYARVGASGRALLEESLFHFCALAADAQLEGASKAGQQMVLPTSLGSVKRAARAQKSIAGSHLEPLAGNNVGVGYFHTEAEFDGRNVAAVLRYTTTCSQVQRRFSVYPFELGYFRRARDAHLSSIELAKQLDDDTAIDALARQMLQNERAGQHLDHLLLPAMIGFSRPETMLFRLQALVGIRMSTCCMLPPSPPGQRLAAALGAGLTRQNVEMIRGQALGVEGRQRRIETIIYKPTGSDRVERIYADNVILATGSLPSRGLVAAGSLFEPIFNLPLFVDDSALCNRRVDELLGEHFNDPHALLRTGVYTDSLLRPLVAAEDDVVYDNLFAAGAILAGNDAVAHKAGLGLCALTGFWAGRCAVASESHR